MHRLLLVLSVLFASAAIGCGANRGDSHGGRDEDEIRSLIKAYNGAFARGDVAAACDLMTEQARALAAGASTGCEVAFKRDARRADSATLRKLADIEILSVELRGVGAEVETSNGLSPLWLQGLPLSGRAAGVKTTLPIHSSFV